MGICPCTRDFTTKPKLPQQPVETALETFTTETETLIPPRTFSSKHASEDVIETRKEPISASFQIVSEVQEAGQIRVLKAVHSNTQKKTQIKVFQKLRIPFQVEGRSQFLQMLLKLDHPNILKTLEVSQDESTLYIITEDYEGGDLETYLGVHTLLSHALASAVIRQVLGALSYCHSQGIIHGALNLKTILLSDTPDADKIDIKLTGFSGNDYLLIGENPPQTWFSAPEAESEELTDRSDIWSCGVLLYILLCGHNPFDSTRSSAVSNKLKIKGINFPPVLWGKTSHDVLTLISSMMSVEPVNRPSAAQCLSHPWILQKAKRLSLTSKKVITPRNRSNIGMLKVALMHFLITRVLKGSEISRLTELLAALDKNADGLLSKDELLTSYRELASTDEEVLLIMQKVERTSTRTVETPSILLPIIHEKNLLHRDNLKLAFNTMGQDEEGRVTIATLQALLRINNGSWTAEQWKELVIDAEGVQEDKMDFNGFRAIVMKVFRS